jgi:competence protein ComEA
MDFESIFAQYAPILKKYWLALALFSLGLIFFIYGLISLLGSASRQSGITFHNIDSASVSTPATVKNSGLILVDVEGAVVAPGVYKLAPNSIVQEALVSAQGLASNADRDFVSKNLNLAAKLTDGAKVYIPKIGEATTDSSTVNSAGGSNSALVNINTADSGTLDSLPGIGPATATKIINARPYSGVNELLDKKVVSAKVFSGIKDKISTY